MNQEATNTTVGLSLKTCARQIDVSKDFIQGLCDTGELEFFRIGKAGMVRVTTVSWRNYLETLTAKLNVGQIQ